MFNKNKHIKKIIAAAAILVAVLIIIVTCFKVENVTSSFECSISKADNGAIKINTNIETLKSKDIEIGDSVNVVFSTNYNAEDVPILNGQFMNSGDYIITTKDESSPLFMQIQDIPNIWSAANLDDNSTISFTLSGKKKFKNLNDAFTMTPVNNQKNVRSLRGGNLRYLDVFRGPNPYSTEEINIYIDHYLKDLSIKNLINLNDNKFECSSMNIKNDSCNIMVIDTLLKISNIDGKIYLYSYNDDLTAYFCAIIEALAGCSYDEIVNDYMETYKNYYGITQENNPLEYDAIKNYHIDSFLHKLSKTPAFEDMTNCDFSYDAEMYLRAHQASEDQITAIKNRINKQ